MFWDLPKDHYPLTLWGISDDTGEVLWYFRVEEPGSVRIPGKPPGVSKVNVVLILEKKGQIITD